MKATLGAIGVLAIATAAVVLAAVAAAGPAASKQRISIQVRAGADRPFVLAPMTPGAIKRDTGTATFCCWRSHLIMRSGQTIDLADPQMTLTSKRGTVVTRNRLEWVEIPDGDAVFTGTWKVIRSTGAYAGLSGGGRLAGIMLANSNTKSRYEGFLTRR
jgi:hypothetical protein